ncbi:MAG: DUF1232 domain-containing protein [Polyangiaceae bacterium]|nr:DUF1232 domain-containing protein [Polyangiaceae bacterium]
MSELNSRCLDAFSLWLANLAEDTRVIVDAVADDSLPVEVRRPLAGALNYLFKSLDLIDDGIEGIGYLDDAFVMRVAAADAGEAAPEGIQKLAADRGLIAEFLDDLEPKFAQFVLGLSQSSVRGRSVEQVVSDAMTRDELLGDVRGWASRYSQPAFTKDEKHLVKLRSFLQAKLPG